MISRAILRREIRREVARLLAAQPMPALAARPVEEIAGPAAPIVPMKAQYRPRAPRAKHTGATPGGAEGSRSGVDASPRDVAAYQGNLSEPAAASPPSRINAGPGTSQTTAQVSIPAKAPDPALPLPVPPALPGGRADQATIRRWGLDHGVRINAMGPLTDHEIRLVNNRRKMLDLTQFILVPDGQA
jgi:hypothetical protein